MNYLSTGTFFGHNDRTISVDGITITETKYDYEFVDWHYHENPHFTFITHGNIRQGTHRGTYECSADTLLFHNSQEPHYNVKPAGITRGFQIEVALPWYKKFEVDLDKLPPIANITQPDARLVFYNIYKEARMTDATGNTHRRLVAVGNFRLHAGKGNVLQRHTALGKKG